ncbi:paraquat-inducible protein A [Motiliproteus sediminis]|uniref:paraquat-inducible protein A n=1 Tax=Motiliproteus sediminis TaxID=1468178 RepID=UPI001AEF9A41|nr:paraquat-inducible protein A [Motiliproteus sediminis]
MLALVWLALGLLLAGISLPLMTVEQLWLFENRFSLWSGLIQMIGEGRWLLALLVGCFSVALPLLKLSMLLRALGGSGSRVRRWLEWMHHYGKWSMLDVFVVAVLLVSVKLGALAKVHIHLGLYAFAASVLLTMMVTGWLMRQSSGAPHT